MSDTSAEKSSSTRSGKVDPATTHAELLAEFAEFCGRQPSPREFCDGLLQRVIAATRSVGGAIWLFNEAHQLAPVSELRLQECAGLSQAEDAQQHALLLKQVCDVRRPITVPPHAGASPDGNAGNPSDYFVSMATLGRGEIVVGVLEIFQPADESEESRQAAVAIFLQFANSANQRLKLDEPQSVDKHHEIWSKLEHFNHVVHHSLHSKTTAYTLTNEGRKLIECDFVHIASWNSRVCRIIAVSGQDTFDARSNRVRLLNQLATMVVRSGEPLWYTGDSSGLAPQIEQAVQEYVDEAHAAVVGVLPLHKPVGPASSKQEMPPTPVIVGAMIVELMQGTLSPGLRERSEMVAKHGGVAIANAVEHESLFLMPVWRTIGNMRWLVRARTLPKTLLAVLTLAIVIGSLFLIEADFDVESKGTLEPVVAREIFAPQDAVVVNVRVEHGQTVAQGDPLVTLISTDVNVTLADLNGKLRSTNEQLRGIDQQRTQYHLPVDERDRLASQAAQLRATYRSLEKQVSLIAAKQQQLVVVSPISGQVVTWQPHDRLANRPVQRGQQLLTVADPTQAWRLDLHVPEDRMGHLAKAQQELSADGKPLAVRYITATSPNQRHDGTVQEIHTTAEIRGDEGNTVLVKVQIDKNDLTESELRAGSTVTAKIHCGRSSLGYCWFRDVINFFHRLWFKVF